MSDAPVSPAVKEANSWLEIVMSLPDGDARFQRELMAAETGNLDPLGAVSLAYAALLVGGTDEAGRYGPWYREKAMSLLRDAAEIMEAMGVKDGEPVN